MTLLDPHIRRTFAVQSQANITICGERSFFSGKNQLVIPLDCFVFRLDEKTFSTIIMESREQFMREVNEVALVRAKYHRTRIKADSGRFQMVAGSMPVIAFDLDH